MPRYTRDHRPRSRSRHRNHHSGTSRHSRRQEQTLSGPAWMDATGGNILGRSSRSVHREDPDDSSLIGGHHASDFTGGRDTVYGDTDAGNDDGTYHESLPPSPKVTTDDFERDRVHHIDHPTLGAQREHEYFFDELSNTRHRSFVPHSKYSHRDWYIWQLRFNRSVQNPPFRIDVQYFGSLSPTIRPSSHAVTENPGHNRIACLAEIIMEKTETPFERRLSFAESLSGLEELLRATQDTIETMDLPARSLQVERVVSVCAEQDFEEGVDGWTHSVWVSVKPLAAI